MILFIISIILIISVFIYIHLAEKKNQNLVNSAKFIFTIGLLATFFGFVLATYATDIQKERDSKLKAISLIGAYSETCKTELKYISLKAGFLEAYLDKKIEKSFRSIIIDNNTNDFFIQNGDTYSYFSDSFKTNLPLMDSYIKNLYQFYNPSGNEEKDLVLLKQIAGLKYLKLKMMEEEIKYLKGDVKTVKNKEFIENIMKDKLGVVIMDAIANKPFNEIVPDDFSKSN